jgi:hypothetical protein
VSFDRPESVCSCRRCLDEWREQSVHATCPVCRADICESADDYQMVEPPNANDVAEYLESSRFSAAPQWWPAFLTFFFRRK